MQSSKPDLSVVIVHYETPDLLRKCLDAVDAARDGLVVEVIVIDNASVGFMPAEWADQDRRVTVLANDRNRGFAAATNEGLTRARGRYLLLLNPDAFVAPDTFASLIEFMDAHPDVGCSTARLEMEDGRLDLACRHLFPTPVRSFYRITYLSKLFPKSQRFAQYNMTYLDEYVETEIDAPCGAFMFVRREVYEQVGPLDEQFFMYCEDVDWALRMKQAGWRVMYVPTTTVRHVKRASSDKFRQRSIKAFHNSMRRFYRKHYQDESPRLLTWLIYRAIAAREIIELTSDRLRGKRQPKGVS